MQMNLGHTIHTTCGKCRKPKAADPVCDPYNWTAKASWGGGKNWRGD